MRKREDWVDTARALGIFAIYMGHFGPAAGKSYEFVFQYHVALFFLLAGAMNTYDNETDFLSFTVKKVKGIMAPFWMFCALSAVVNVIQADAGLADVKRMAFLVAKGAVRNTFFAGSLWFLTCLFLMEVCFKLLRCWKHKGLIFAVCTAMHLIAERVITPPPISEPHWLYNLDSVFYYMIFFAVGYVAYPYILDLFKLDTRLKRVCFFVSGGGGVSLLRAALERKRRHCLCVWPDWASCRVRPRREGACGVLAESGGGKASGTHEGVSGTWAQHVVPVRQ